MNPPSNPPVSGIRSSDAGALRAADRQLITAIRKSHLTYLSEERLVSIAETIRSADDERIPGIFIETGCALGGSTILIATVKNPGRALYVYDVFAMIPSPTARDGPDVHERFAIIKSGKSEGLAGEKYYGYEVNLYEKVRASLRSFGIDETDDHVSLVKGLLQETMRIEDPVAFAHIDVDWYEPVRTCLERIIPRLSVGGSVILDDYHCWSGCRDATDAYFNDNRDHFRFDDSAESMKITRLA